MKLLLILFSVFGVFCVLPYSFGNFADAQAVIVDGDLVKTSDNPDVYIVKIINNKKFKRLILNPDIFNSYGHLRWENIKTVSQGVVDGYALSEFVIEVNADGSVFDPKVYRVRSAANSDVGERRWLNISSAEFNSAGFDWDSIYHVNHTEASVNFYPTGAELRYADILAERQGSTPVTVKFTIEADDIAFYMNSEDLSAISVNKGEMVEITYNVRSTNVYYGGLDFRGCGQSSATVSPGGSIVVKFTADSTCTITSYWPTSGVVKDSMTVNMQ